MESDRYRTYGSFVRMRESRPCGMAILARTLHGQGARATQAALSRATRKTLWAFAPYTFARTSSGKPNPYSGQW